MSDQLQRRSRTCRVRALAGVGAVAATLALGACGDNQGAAIACEQFVDQRVGVGAEHRSPSEGATETQPGRWVLRSAYVEPRTGARTAYTCTVDRLDTDGWRLVDLRADR